MRKRKIKSIAANALKSATDKLPNVSLPTLGRTKTPSSVRKPLTILGTVVGAGVLGFAVRPLLEKGRYKTGEAPCRGIYDYESDKLMGEPGILVSLYGVTFWAPAEQREAFELAAKGDQSVPYRVDTWRRRKDGLLTGAIGESFFGAFPGGTYVRAEEDKSVNV